MCVLAEDDVRLVEGQPRLFTLPLPAPLHRQAAHHDALAASHLHGPFVPRVCSVCFDTPSHLQYQCERVLVPCLRDEQYDGERGRLSEAERRPRYLDSSTDGRPG